VTRARDEAILTVTFHFHFGLVFLGRRQFVVRACRFTVESNTDSYRLCGPVRGRRHSVISWVAPGPSGSDVKLTADRSDGFIWQSYGVVLFTLVSKVFKLKKSFSQRLECAAPMSFFIVRGWPVCTFACRLLSSG
jgi:hypothetical protein